MMGNVQFWGEILEGYLSCLAATTALSQYEEIEKAFKVCSRSGALQALHS